MIKVGLEVFLDQYVEQFKDERVGLLTNPTGVNRRLVSTVDLFQEKLHLCALFAPEHGIRANLQEGESFEDTIDPVTGLPIYSLYGKQKRPTEEMLASLDVIFVDIQDIGSRYYTFVYTLANVMDACREYGVKVVVLDRPNPIGGHMVEGNFIEEDFFSFIGMYPIPNRHGMTIGELATMFNNHFAINCDLAVIEMEGWQRNQFFDELNIPWVPPSPNVTNISMQLLYPGTCLIEGTNLSEGRGTVRPFEVIGAPFIDGFKLAQFFNEIGLEGILARPTSFKPTYSKYYEEVCHGIQLHVIDRHVIKPVEIGIRLIELIYSMYPEQLEFITYEQLEHPFFDLLAGTDQLRKNIMNQEVESFISKMNEDRRDFYNIRKKYLLYR